MAFGKLFIPSLIGFTSLTRPSFKSFYMSVTRLKNFESLYCVLKSPTRSDKKFCWMFCLVLRNSLSIKTFFLESVIFRNDMFLLATFFYSSNAGLNTVWDTVLNTVLNIVLNSVLNTVLNMVLNSFEHCFERGFLTWF